ncbi:hypothetical protein GQ44DRAFT_249174 [Phaeosphaeriaceae sp. PMI808]|nr:hypothetical protein GQ44DRAFT_249174 [Phaeosphaeriaceae sp. PMI808]
MICVQHAGLHRCSHVEIMQAVRPCCPLWLLSANMPSVDHEHQAGGSPGTSTFIKWVGGESLLVAATAVDPHRYDVIPQISNPLNVQNPKLVYTHRISLLTIYILSSCCPSSRWGAQVADWVPAGIWERPADCEQGVELWYCVVPSSMHD